MTVPARLNKEENMENQYEAWILDHAHIFVPVSVIILLILIGILVKLMLGNAFSTEANLYYYHLRGIILCVF